MHRQEKFTPSDTSVISQWLRERIPLHLKLIDVYKRLPTAYWDDKNRGDRAVYNFFHHRDQLDLHSYLAELCKKLADCLDKQNDCKNTSLYETFKLHAYKMSDSHFIKLKMDHLDGDMQRVLQAVQKNEKLLFDEYHSLIDLISNIEPEKPTVIFNEDTMSAIPAFQWPTNKCEAPHDLTQCPREISVTAAEAENLYSTLDYIKQTLLDNKFEEIVKHHGKQIGFNLAVSGTASFIIDMVGYLAKKTSGSDTYANVATTITGVAITMYAESYLSSAAFVVAKQGSRLAGFREPASNTFGLLAAAGVHIASDFSLNNAANVGVSMVTALGGSMIGRGVSFFAKKGIDKAVECVRGKKEMVKLHDVKIA